MTKIQALKLKHVAEELSFESRLNRTFLGSGTQVWFDSVTQALLDTNSNRLVALRGKVVAVTPRHSSGWLASVLQKDPKTGEEAASEYSVAAIIFATGAEPRRPHLPQKQVADSPLPF